MLPIPVLPAEFSSQTKRATQVKCPFSEGADFKRNNGKAASVEVRAQLCSSRQENADRHKESRAQAKQRRDKRQREMKFSEEGVSDLKFH